ncbi:exocyst complex component 6B [Sphaerodactylus townsendi]|uniref:exocyst complex component 6B n=1 Tax=Sphaerodactylus townsendi TaxID=933632 RepID=UPI002025DE93|nr:exocyst complex component 6B [Sphaerodactylus townsendi]
MAEAGGLEAASEHERILREVDSTDTACIGPTLRSVYDGEEHGQFMQKLDARIRNHDREIEKMCNFHYQGFVDAITEFLKVRAEAQKLKNQVTDTNRKLQVESKKLVGAMDELKQCRLQQRNISVTVDKLTQCLPVLEMDRKLREQMKSKRHYPALKSLEHLEHTYLPQVSHYRFCKVMVDSIPSLREEIKAVSMSDLKDFLESIRKHSDKIGETAMKQAQQQRNLDHFMPRPCKTGSRRLKRDAGLSSDLGGQNSSPMSEQDSGILDVEEEEEEEVPGAQELVDFSPVYRCLHIYSVLGARETFESYYRKQRRKQARLVLQPPSNMHETLNGYRKYFNQIVGFFVIEDHVLHTLLGLVDRAYLEELWDMALSKTIAVLRTHSSYCSDPDLVLDLKNLIVLFADTLQGYGFPVHQLFDLLLEIRDQYSETLLKKWAGVFRNILDLDNYSPIPVVSEELYQKVVGQFPFHDAELAKQPFPKKFPFSEFVPKVYIQIKEFIYACLKFSEDLHLSSTEVDDMIRKSTNLLLTRTLSSCLQNAIKRRNVGLTEAQISARGALRELHVLYWGLGLHLALDARDPSSPVDGSVTLHVENAGSVRHKKNLGRQVLAKMGGLDPRSTGAVEAYSAMPPGEGVHMLWGPLPAALVEPLTISSTSDKAKKLRWTVGDTGCGPRPTYTPFLRQARHRFPTPTTEPQRAIFCSLSGLCWLGRWLHSFPRKKGWLIEFCPRVWQASLADSGQQKQQHFSGRAEAEVDQTVKAQTQRGSFSGGETVPDGHLDGRRPGSPSQLWNVLFPNGRLVIKSSSRATLKALFHMVHVALSLVRFPPADLGQLWPALSISVLAQERDGILTLEQLCWALLGRKARDGHAENWGLLRTLYFWKDLPDPEWALQAERGCPCKPLLRDPTSPCYSRGQHDKQTECNSCHRRLREHLLRNELHVQNSVQHSSEVKRISSPFQGGGPSGPPGEKVADGQLSLSHSALVFPARADQGGLCSWATGSLIADLLGMSSSVLGGGALWTFAVAALVSHNHPVSGACLSVSCLASRLTLRDIFVSSFGTEADRALRIPPLSECFLAVGFVVVPLGSSIRHGSEVAEFNDRLQVDGKIQLQMIIVRVHYPACVKTSKAVSLTSRADCSKSPSERLLLKIHQKLHSPVPLLQAPWFSWGSNHGWAFPFLTGKVAQTACMSACKHLSTSLMQLLLEAEVRQLSLGALRQFNLDVEECEQFARSGPVPGFQGDTLQLAFIDLRQLLDLFLQWDWSTYLADYGQPTCKYLRVNPATALVLLEKISREMKDSSRKNNVFAQFRKNERDKQKLLEGVAKQLRSLVHSQHS